LSRVVSETTNFSFFTEAPYITNALNNMQVAES